MSRDQAKAFYTKGAGEPTEGFITPEDAKSAIDVIYDDIAKVNANEEALATLIAGLGDLSAVHIEGGLSAFIETTQARLAALEHHTPTPNPTPLPTAETTLNIDNYGQGFARVIWNDLLNDELEHWVTFALATTPGTNGELIATTAALAAMNGNLWIDHNGSLGNVVGTNDQGISNIAASNYIAQNRLVKVKATLNGGQGRPKLTVLETVTPPA